MEPDQTSTETLPLALAQRVLEIPDTGRRRLIGIAGAPASGKTTLAEALVEELRRRGNSAENVPMDGFHLDNRLLDLDGTRARKGAPETFDAAGFLHMIRRLRDEAVVHYPVFDRVHDQAIAGAGRVNGDCTFVIVEGNYLLFAQEPWRQLADLWDLSIWIETEENVVRDRCIQRWLDHGHTPDAARARAEENDLRNARQISGRRLKADMVISTA